MLLLLIEDDEVKRQQIRDWLHLAFPSFEVTECGSIQSGLRALLSQSYALVLLDMSLPTYDVGGDDEGGRPQSFGGREVLKQMRRRHILSPAIVITQYSHFEGSGEVLTLETLSAELETEFPALFVGTVRFNSTLDSWKSDLQASILAALLKGASPGEHTNSG